MRRARSDQTPYVVKRFSSSTYRAYRADCPIAAFLHLTSDATVAGADEEVEFVVRVANVDGFLSHGGEGHAALAPLTLRDAAVDAIVLGAVVRLWEWGEGIFELVRYYRSNSF